MRLTINIMIPVMVLGLVAGVIFYDRSQRQEVNVYRQAQDELTRLRGQATYRGAMREVRVSRAGFPQVVREEWFEGESLPTNVLIPGRQCWLDIAPPGDMFEHPPDPIAFRSSQGGFWYNPNIGVIRARVPWKNSTKEALAAYNRVNGSDLKAFPVAGDISKRQPLAHTRFVTPGAMATVEE